jgi:hypothetical protein
MSSHQARRLVVALSIVAAFLLAATASAPARAATAPSPVLSPESVDFGSPQLGESSDPFSVTLSNAGPDELSFWRFGIASSSANPGDFLIVPGGSCVVGVPVAVDESCTVLVRFRPLDEGERSGLLSFWVNTPAGRVDAVLTGTGLAGSDPSLAPGSVDFGSRQLGQSSDPVALTLSNAGAGALSFWRFGIASSSANPGDFLVVAGGTCTVGAPLASGESCTVLVRFRPLAVGDRSGLLSFWVNTPAGRIDAALAGAGSAAPLPSFSPGVVDFGTVELGRTTSPVTVTLSNSGQGLLSFWRFGIATTSPNAADFSIVPGGSCVVGVPVAPGQSCTVLVRAKAKGAGTRKALLSFWVNTQAGRIDLALSADVPDPCALGCL